MVEKTSKNFSTDFEKVHKISNFMKIRQEGAELFHANGRTDRHDETNGRSSQSCERF